jgi:hypothetical protein
MSSTTHIQPGASDFTRVPAATPVVRDRRAARITSPRFTRKLAQGLRKAVDEPKPVNGMWAIRITGTAANDPVARAACLELAKALEVASAPDPDVIVGILHLLGDADSPLQGTSPSRLLADVTDLTRRLA